MEVSLVHALYIPSFCYLKFDVSRFLTFSCSRDDLNSNSFGPKVFARFPT